VTGQVLGPAGKPLAGARVAFDDALRGAVSGPDGRFRIEDLPAGEYELSTAAFGLGTDRGVSPCRRPAR
jgi:hypothetical protein